MSLPLYTSSRLYRVTAPAFGRGFFPASTKPRWVVGIRCYSREEMPKDPFGFELQLPQAAPKMIGTVTLIDAFTAQPIIRGLPLARINMFSIRSLTKSLSPLANGSTNPLLFPMAMPRRCNVGGSWIRNPTRDPLRAWVEVFYYDETDD